MSKKLISCYVDERCILEKNTLGKKWEAIILDGLTYASNGKEEKIRSQTEKIMLENELRLCREKCEKIAEKLQKYISKYGVDEEILYGMKQ